MFRSLRFVVVWTSLKTNWTYSQPTVWFQAYGKSCLWHSFEHGRSTSATKDTLFKNVQSCFVLFSSTFKAPAGGTKRYILGYSWSYFELHLSVTNNMTTLAFWSIEEHLVPFLWACVQRISQNKKVIPAWVEEPTTKFGKRNEHCRIKIREKLHML